eukprot:3462047-Pleurochrysis_carterae.AAC.1
MSAALLSCSDHGSADHPKWDLAVHLCLNLTHASRERAGLARARRVSCARPRVSAFTSSRARA